MGSETNLVLRGFGRIKKKNKGLDDMGRVFS